jgi:Anti-sigma factor NepR
MDDTSDPRDTRSTFYFATEAERSRAIRASIGSRLREMYGDLLQEPLPLEIGDLLGRLNR